MAFKVGSTTVANNSANIPWARVSSLGSTATSASMVFGGDLGMLPQYDFSIYYATLSGNALVFYYKT